MLVVGDVMLDRYLFGGTSRISPEAPVPVVHVQQNEDRAGGAANVAANLAHLGVHTSLLGMVGNDDEAAALQSAIEGQGVYCELTAVDGWPTITKIRIQSRGQQLIRIDQEAPVPSGTEALLKGLEARLGDTDVVVLSDYGKGSLRDVSAMIIACNAKNVPVFVDPKGADFDKYRDATVITPNQAEFDVVAGVPVDDVDMVSRASEMMMSLGLSGLLVTRSKKGMLLVEGKGEPQFLPARAREVYDVTGAGDTVIAAFAASVAAGSNFGEAAALANLAAGLAVGKIGVAAVTPSELSVALHRLGQGGRGLVSEEELLPLIGEVRDRGERVIMTNGCFDVLHAGHVAYLEEAKSLGDRLIVAINDDDSVRRLKGESRPINRLEDRMLVLAGLASVDWVVSFTEDTPERLIAAVLPDVLVKGGDYKVEEIAGARDVLDHGGDVRILPFCEGHSSSRIIEKLGD